MSLRHLVLFRFKPTATAQEVAGLIEQFGRLPREIPGILGFEHGLDNSPEGLAKGFTHAFLVTFENAAARDAYLPHPAHKAFVERVGPSLDDVLVIDYAPQAAVR